MNKNKGFIGIGLIIAIVLGIVVVGGGAYFLGKSGSKQAINNPEINQNQNLPVDNSKQVNITNPTVPPVTTGCTSSSVPSITVLSPNGGETYKAGDKITVKWKSCNLAKDKLVYIGLTSELNGNNDTVTLSSQTENDGTEVVSLPQKNITSGNSYKVGISYYYQTDTSYFDNSDNYFTINSATVNSSEESSTESFKSQSGAIKSIKADGANKWIFAVDLLSSNPNWVPGENEFFINQNTKIRNLNVTANTKTYNCAGTGRPDLLVATSSYVSNIQDKINKAKTDPGLVGHFGYTAYFDINGTNITAIYEQCLP